MPLVTIESTLSRSPAEITAIIDAVYQAQIDAFRLPPDDKQIRYVEHPRHCFPVPPGKTENYTIVTFSIFPGRSLEAKRKLYAGLAQGLGRLGIGPSDLMVTLHEPPLQNWGVRGLPATDVDLGIDLNV